MSKDGFGRYYARQADCVACAFEQRCCPSQRGRKFACHVHEAARDVARPIVTMDAFTDASRRRKKVEMLFAHLKRIDRLHLRRPNGAKDALHLAGTAQKPPKPALLVPADPTGSVK